MTDAVTDEPPGDPGNPVVQFTIGDRLAGESIDDRDRAPSLDPVSREEVAEGNGEQRVVLPIRHGNLLYVASGNLGFLFSNHAFTPSR